MLGISAAIGASVLWGFNPALIKLGVGREVSSVAFNFLRAISSIPAIVLTIIMFKENVLFPTTFHGWIAVLIASVIGPGIGDIAYIGSIRSIGSGKAITIGYTYILISQVLALLLFKERVSTLLFLGSTLAIIGIWLTVAEGSKEGNKLQITGIASALVASLAWGVGTIANKYALMQVSALSLALLRMCVLSPIMMMLSIRKLSKLPRRTVLIAIATGITSYGIGIPLFLYAINIVGVSTTVLTTALTPVIGRIASRLIAGEATSALGFLGTLVTIIGIIIGTLT